MPAGPAAGPEWATGVLRAGSECSQGVPGEPTCAHPGGCRTPAGRVAA